MNRVKNLIPTIIIESMSGNKVGIFHPCLVFPDIWEKLTEDNNYNEKIWTIINKKVAESTPSVFRSEFFAYAGFITRIDSAYSDLDYWERKTNGEKKERANDISKLAKELSKKLKDTPFDTQVFEYFCHEFYLNFLIKQSGGSDLNMDALPMDLTDKFNMLGACSPNISILMENLSEVVIASPDLKGTLSKVNADDAKVTHFVRIVSDWMNKHFGSPCHELNSLLAGGIYEQPFTIEDIKNKLRRYNRSDGSIQFTDEYISRSKFYELPND
jgi:hypothetical protein